MTEKRNQLKEMKKATNNAHVGGIWGHTLRNFTTNVIVTHIPTIRQETSTIDK